MVKRFGVSIDEKVFDALEKRRKKNLGINRSRMIEVLLARELGVRLEDGLAPVGCTPKNLRRRFLLGAKKWWRFW
jgi:hypothetical protein